MIHPLNMAFRTNRLAEVYASGRAHVSATERDNIRTLYQFLYDAATFATYVQDGTGEVSFRGIDNLGDLIDRVSPEELFNLAPIVEQLKRDSHAPEVLPTPEVAAFFNKLAESYTSSATQP